jgi:hypothetical protein
MFTISMVTAVLRDGVDALVLHCYVCVGICFGQLR